MSIETLQRARTSRADERVTVDDLGYRDDGITHMTARFGFMDEIDVPRHAAHGGRATWRASSTSSAPPTSSRASRSCRPTRPGMARWRKKLFIAIARNAANPVALFGLPDDQTVVLSAHIEL